MRSHFRTWVIVIMIVLSLPSYSVKRSSPATIPEGAWERTSGTLTERILIVNDYLVLTAFDKATPAFHYTWGGPVSVSGNDLAVNLQFDTRDREAVGNTRLVGGKASAGVFIVEGSTNKDSWKPLDQGNAPLSGVWRISGRMQNGTISEMPLRARRTLKMLTGTCFQWTAINTETGEFFGTGGGRYEFADGRYTERIEYFSRDSSRVGSSLSFDGKIENGQWHHSGLSSRGDKIYEIWSRLNP